MEYGHEGSRDSWSESCADNSCDQAVMPYGCSMALAAVAAPGMCQGHFTSTSDWRRSV